MKCEKAMELILDGATGGAELKSHLAKCPGCAGMARQWHSLKVALPSRASDSLSVPPLEIDVRIHAAALAKARSFRSRRVFFKLAASFAAAAAVAAVTAIVALYMPSSVNSSKSSSIAWESVALNEDLLKLSSDIDASSALLSTPGKEQSQQGIDNSLQAISVDVPDLLT